MNDTKEKRSTDVLEIDDDTENLVKEAIEAMNIKELVAEIKDFDKKHQERRKKLFNGTRRRTRGGII